MQKIVELHVGIQDSTRPPARGQARLIPAKKKHSKKRVFWSPNLSPPRHACLFPKAAQQRSAYHGNALSDPYPDGRISRNLSKKRNSGQISRSGPGAAADGLSRPSSGSTRAHEQAHRTDTRGIDLYSRSCEHQHGSQHPFTGDEPRRRPASRSWPAGWPSGPATSASRTALPPKPSHPRPASRSRHLPPCRSLPRLLRDRKRHQRLTETDSAHVRILASRDRVLPRENTATFT